MVPQILQAGWFHLSSSSGWGSLGHGTEGCWTMLHLWEEESGSTVTISILDFFCVYCDITTACYVPVELCLSFSFFFFLHFQGLKMRPRLASLLFRRMGGVWTPVTRQPDLSTLCWSTSSTAATVKEKKGGWGWYSMSGVQQHTDTDRTHAWSQTDLYI